MAYDFSWVSSLQIFITMNPKTVIEGPNTMTPEEKEQTEKNAGFISAPSLDECKPTEAEQEEARQLRQWMKDSKKSNVVIGQPQPPKSLETGKWRYIIREGVINTWVSTVYCEDGKTIIAYRRSKQEAQQIAARIVECVNFCDGVSSDNLKSWYPAKQVIDSVKVLRDDLVTADNQITSLKSKLAKAAEEVLKWQQIYTGEIVPEFYTKEEVQNLKSKLILAQSQAATRILPPFTPEKMPGISKLIFVRTKDGNEYFGPYSEVSEDRFGVGITGLSFPICKSITVLPEISEGGKEV